MYKTKANKFFVAFQIFLIVTAGVFTFSYFSANSNASPSGMASLAATTASGCTINPVNVWNCPHYTTTLPSNVAYSGIPTSLTLNQPYTFNVSVHVNKLLSNLINGKSDNFGISLARVDQSPIGTSIDTPNNTITVESLSQNRGADSNLGDLQEAVYNNASPIGAGKQWSTYQCAGSLKSVANVTVGQTYAFSCIFTPTRTGFYQVDVNSQAYYNNSTQNCVQGLCGPIAALFVKVDKTVPTETPTATATPTPTSTPTGTPTPSAECTNIILSDATNTSQVYPNNSQVTPIQVNGQATNNSRNINATITGTANNISSLGVKWAVTGTDATTSQAITVDESSQLSNIQTNGNGQYSATYTFRFGPFDSGKNFDSSNITANHNYVYSINPSLYINNQLFSSNIPNCNGRLLTTSVGTVLPTQTTASITVTKTRITNEPITVGQDATFKITITNSGTEPLTNVMFDDNYGNTGVMSYKSGNVFETNSGTNSGTVDISQQLVNSANNGTTTTINLTSLNGMKNLQPNDSFTLMLTFTGQSATANNNTTTDVATGTGTSTVSNNKVTNSAEATVTFSPIPSSPNTGADTGITFGALALLLASIAGKKYFLKFLIG